MASLDEQARWLNETAGVYVTSNLVVRVSGDDALSWLNGQVTNDVREPSQERAIYALAVTVKGRVLSDLWVHHDGEQLRIVIPASQREALIESFEKHIIMEDVELELEQGLCVISVQGPRSAEVARAVASPRLSYLCPRLRAEGTDLVVEAAELDSAREALAARAAELGGGAIDDAGWAHRHILSGIPRIGIDFGESCYPQEAGLKDHAVSFNKGCYLGQEVVYMLENRGQLSRRLVLLEGGPGVALAAGTTLLDAEGKRLGEVTSSTVTGTPPTTTMALGYLKRQAAEVDARVTAEGRELRVSHVVGVTNAPCPLVAR